MSDKRDALKAAETFSKTDQEEESDFNDDDDQSLLDRRLRKFMRRDRGSNFRKNIQHKRDSFKNL